MSSVSGIENGALKHWLEVLNKEKDGNTIECLKLSIVDERLLIRASTNLLWKILSHPYSKVTKVKVKEYIADGLARSSLMEALKRWCKEVPTLSSRELNLSFNGDNSEKSQQVLDDLREALEHPNNRVEKLSFDIDDDDSTGIALHVCDRLLRPVLETPNNELTELRLSGRVVRDEDEARALAVGLASESCKVKTFEINGLPLMLMNALPILDGLYAARHLERLYWSTDNGDAMTTGLITRLGRLLERPGNQMRSLTLRITAWSEKQVMVLSNALMVEHCRLEEFDCDLRGEVSCSALAITLRHPNTRLKSLRIPFSGKDTAAALEGSLKDPNCKLESLKIVTERHPICDEKVAIGIAEALKKAPTLTRLRVLDLGACDNQPAIFRAFTESLHSRNNKITELYLCGVESLNEATRHRFNRALRTSSVVRFVDRDGGSAFLRAFHAPFLQVLHTLLSVKFVPRLLGASTWMRILPVQDFIIGIAETLGWPLKDLC